MPFPSSLSNFTEKFNLPTFNDAAKVAADVTVFFAPLLHDVDREKLVSWAGSKTEQSTPRQDPSLQQGELSPDELARLGQTNNTASKLNIQMLTKFADTFANTVANASGTVANTLHEGGEKLNKLSDTVTNTFNNATQTASKFANAGQNKVINWAKTTTEKLTSREPQKPTTTTEELTSPREPQKPTDELRTGEISNLNQIINGYTKLLEFNEKTREFPPSVYTHPSAVPPDSVVKGIHIKIPPFPQS